MNEDQAQRPTLQCILMNDRSYFAGLRIVECRCSTFIMYPIGNNRIDLANSLSSPAISPPSYLGLQHVHSLFLSPVTGTGIEKEITNVNATKATRPFSIPTVIETT